MFPIYIHPRSSEAYKVSPALCDAMVTIIPSHRALAMGAMGAMGGLSRG